MKTVNTIVKILTALAAVAGAVYVIATYGDKIVAWAKKVLSSMPKCPSCEEAEVAEAAAEEVPVEEAPAEEEAAVEVTIEVPAEAPAENEPVAEEADFEA